MENLRAFKVEAVPAGDNTPARVKITDLRFSQSLTISYSAGSASTAKELATEFLQKKGITVIANAWAENKQSEHLYTLLLSNNFTNRIK